MSRSRLFQSSSFSASRAGLSRSHAGFTIVELLVAAAITLVVLGLMIQVTFTVLGTFGKVSGTLTARAEATTALNYLRDDFQSIVWRRDGNVWLLATIQPDQTGQGEANRSYADWTPDVPKPGNANPGADFSSLKLDAPGATAGNWIDLRDYRFGQAGVWLRFFTNQSSMTTQGNRIESAPVAVAYQIMRIEPRDGSSEFRYQFFRSVVRPGREVTANARSVLDAGYNLTSNAVDGYNRPSSTNDALGDPGSIRSPNRDALIANNVIDFGVRFWRMAPPPGSPAGTAPEPQLIFPAAPNGRPSETNLGFAATSVEIGDIVDDANGSLPPDAQMTVGFPDFADVFLRVLTDEGARLIEAFENENLAATSPTGGTPSPDEIKAFWWKIAEENSEVFTERIPINARPF